jgi:hypothetical protein
MLIDVAVIAPVAHLGDLTALGTIDMALTHLALAYPAYAAHYAAQAAAGRTVILDNSAYELEDTAGAGLAAGPVLKAAQMTGAAEVVCTDVPYDGPRTIRATRRFLSEAADHGHRVRYMGVPQGSTRAEWLTCYEALVDTPGIDVIGLSKLSVPRCWAASVTGARLACAAELHRAGPPPKPLHLLGGDQSLPAELRRHRELAHTAVRSNDSSMTTWYAALGLPLDPRTGHAEREAPAKPELERTRLDPGQLAAARANIAILREHAGLPQARQPDVKHSYA